MTTQDIRAALEAYADRRNWLDDGSGVRRVWSEPDSTTPEAYPGFDLAVKALAALSAQPAGADAHPTWPHVANEWADMASNGIQWARNIKDGISTPDEAIAGLMTDLKHCQEVSAQRHAMDAAPPTQQEGT